jgi:hypothetical protein
LRGFLRALAVVLIAGGIVGGIKVGEAINSGQASSLRSLQEQSAGECYRVNYARWLNDRANYARWQTDTTVIHDLAVKQRQEQRKLKHAHGQHHAQLESAIKENNGLLRVLRADAQSTRYAPLTDCAQAIERPSTYVPPVAVPFSSRRFHARSLRSPPPTPAQGHY